MWLLPNEGKSTHALSVARVQSEWRAISGEKKRRQGTI
jgi:hypothetical protein